MAHRHLLYLINVERRSLCATDEASSNLNHLKTPACVFLHPPYALSHASPNQHNHPRGPHLYPGFLFLPETLGGVEGMVVEFRALGVDGFGGRVDEVFGEMVDGWVLIERGIGSVDGVVFEIQVDEDCVRRDGREFGAVKDYGIQHSIRSGSEFEFEIQVDRDCRVIVILLASLSSPLVLAKVDLEVVIENNR